MAGAAALGGPHQPPRLIVERDDWLAHHHAVDKSDDARARFEFRVGDEAGDESRMQRADVANRRPDVARRRACLEFGSKRRHRSFPAVIGFEPIAFRVMDEGRVIVRPIILAQSRLAIVAAAMRHRRLVERLDALAARRSEAEVEPGLWIIAHWLLRRVDPEARGLFAVTERRLVGAETGQSKRLERRVIKRLGLRDVANADRYVVEHEWFLLLQPTSQ